MVSAANEQPEAVASQDLPVVSHHEATADEFGNRESPAPAPALEPWEKELRAEVAGSDAGRGLAVVTDLRQWLVDNTDFGKTWKWTHETMRDNLQASGNVQPVRFYLRPAEQSLHAAWCFGSAMVGHPAIVHGGAIAFAYDETFGILFASLNMGRGFTANLTVNYRQPLPALATACLTVSLDRRDGRKVYLAGSLKDSPNGTVYSEASALFIIARD